MTSALRSSKWHPSRLHLLRGCNWANRRNCVYAVIGINLAIFLCYLTSHTFSLRGDKSNCTGYFELRHTNFFEDKLRTRLCENVTAFTVVHGKFPMCQLSIPLPESIENEVSAEALSGYIISKATGHNISVLAYRGSDLITQQITRYHAWEPQLVTRLIEVMRSLPQGSVTFLDVGSNIGVYSLQALDAGFPTIAVDANIRSLVRLRLSARRMGWSGDRFRMFWAFFDSRVSIRYLKFNTESCNIGGSGGSGDERDPGTITDTVPVMTAVADELIAHLGTQLTVMKIDIESSEIDFFETGRRLFAERQVVAVQMEWWRASNRDSARSSPNHRYYVDFFTSRDYVLLAPLTLEALDPEAFWEWDTLWVKRSYLDIVRSSLKH